VASKTSARLLFLGVTYGTYLNTSLKERHTGKHMKVASIIVPPYLEQNRLFELDDPITNRDGCLLHYSLLRDELADMGIHLATHDKNKPKVSDLVIYNDYPRRKSDLSVAGRKILLLFETEVIRPDNWIYENHAKFDVVFTWRDDLERIDPYRKFNFPNRIPENFERWARSTKERFCVVISGNKSASHPLELYSERLKAIRWFERYHPDHFDLFGIGWDLHNFSGFLRPLNRLHVLRRLVAENRPSYRGRVHSKIEVLSQYKFSICYENAGGVQGYVTEKMLDCLFSGCVPIYLGATNISRHFPRDCFIDKNSFPDYEALFDYMESMNESERQRFVEAGIDFVRGPGMVQYSAEFFAKSVSSAATSLLPE